MIRDRFAVGLRNDNLSEKSETNLDLTLEHAVQQARQSENVKKKTTTTTTRSNPIAPGSSKRRKALQLRNRGDLERKLHPVS